MSDTLLIYDAVQGGAVVAVAACNQKSRTKSLEQGELWIVDPATGRVLPFADGGVGYDRFVQRDSWWEVRRTGRDVGAVSERGSSAEEVVETPGGHRRFDAPIAAPDSEDTVPRTETVLSALGDLIAERHRTMPEGSYTTHLFTKGPEKIRKKVGEEAVEVILAAGAEEIRSEAADLVYHMIVLLEAEGLRMEEVLSELDRRHRKG